MVEIIMELLVEPQRHSSILKGVYSVRAGM
jgi:hypothetical protein